MNGETRPNSVTSLMSFRYKSPTISSVCLTSNKRGSDTVANRSVTLALISEASEGRGHDGGNGHRARDDDAS